MRCAEKGRPISRMWSPAPGATGTERDSAEPEQTDSPSVTSTKSSCTPIADWAVSTAALNVPESPGQEAHHHHSKGAKLEQKSPPAKVRLPESEKFPCGK